MEAGPTDERPLGWRMKNWRILPQLSHPVSSNLRNKTDTFSWFRRKKDIISDLISRSKFHALNCQVKFYMYRTDKRWQQIWGCVKDDAKEGWKLNRCLSDFLQRETFLWAPFKTLWSSFELNWASSSPSRCGSSSRNICVSFDGCLAATLSKGLPFQTFSPLLSPPSFINGKPFPDNDKMRCLQNPLRS